MTDKFLISTRARISAFGEECGFGSEGTSENSPAFQGALPESRVVGRVTPCAPLWIPQWQQFLDFTMSIDLLTSLVLLFFDLGNTPFNAGNRFRIT